MRLTYTLTVFGMLLSMALAPVTRAGSVVTDFRLDNGMDVVVIEDHRAAVVTHMVWYRVGAADEPWGHSGIAHFFEHLMFKATDKIADGEFSKIVAANGGSDNAFTSHDYTAYYQRIASDRLELVMDMEANRMRNLLLTDAVVATERAVILEERNQRTDNSPQALFNEQMESALYMNHPYGVPVIGWRHEMEKLNLADAQAFYARYYAPDNAILVVAGDVTPEQVRALAETYYGPLLPSGRPPEARPQEPPQLAPRRIEMHDAQVRQPYVMRNYLVPTFDPSNPRESAALSILSDILGDGITSRLAQALQLEQKVAIDSGSYYTPGRRDQTNFSVYGVPAPGQDLAIVEAAIDAVLVEMATNGPTEEELARVKRLNRAALIFAQDELASQARLYGAALASGGAVADVQNWPAVIEAVTAEDVRLAAEKYLVLEHSVTGWLVRTKETQ
ncbi:MAG TPA: pitrilysin family protein [Thermohalobaculum sp.]|nr:pitrilysin family protein [Thermohalobaculum sp.]